MSYNQVKFLCIFLNLIHIFKVHSVSKQLYLLVGLDNGDVAHSINPVICFLTKAKRLKFETELR